jgi:capsular polysaccharide biosynthesis protein
VTELLAAYGIEEGDIHFATENERVTRLVAPSLLWHNAIPYHFHPAVRTVWDSLRGNLARLDEGSPRRVFVSRGSSATSRVCRNGTDVERFFEERGFTVVKPESLSLEEQATLFFNADDIAGFAGAAMFNLIFAGRRPRVTVLSHESYTARNEQLIASSVARELHYFWSRADVSQPKNRYSPEAFLSDWEFDFARNGKELEALLASANHGEAASR